MVPDVATSISCRDISSKNCNIQLSTSNVATSVPCLDINLCLWRLHWLFLVSRLQSSIATTVGVISVSFFSTCHSFKALLLSRPPSLVATSISCRDIIPSVSDSSSAAFLLISVATCIKFPSIFLMSRHQDWTVQAQNCNLN